MSTPTGPRTPAAASSPAPPWRVCVVIVNYRTPQLAADAVRSALAQIDADTDRIVVVDNGSADGSVAALRAAHTAERWGDAVMLLALPDNAGFSAGNNRGIAAAPARVHVLLNSDARLADGALAALVDALEKHPEAGLVGPRIVDSAGRVQASAFRDHTPLGELLEATDLGWLRRRLVRHDPLLPPPETPLAVDWLSFACVALRAEVIERIGPLDEGYFLYFEDLDYCRRAREAGFAVLHWPAARAVHSEGASSPVPASRSGGGRPPRYFYASRSRYFARFYGRRGLWYANLLRIAGRPVGWLRSLRGQPRASAARREWLDIWHGALAVRADAPRPPGASRSREEALR